jgi:folate-binding protein YgfZ
MSLGKSEYEWATEERALIPVDGLGLVELTGSDALEWLQGQATNDLRGLSGDDPISFCLCEPTGQLLAVCDVWKREDRLWVSTDNVAAVLDRAEKMVILEDVEARDISNDYVLASVQGPTAVGYLEFFSLSIEPQLDPSECVILPRSVFGTPGWDIRVPKSKGMGFGPISTGTYEVLRIEFGVPKRGVDYTSKTLPPELGPAFEAKYISYNKGCYTGQEVLMRMHSRGHTNKTWMGLLLDAPVEVGALVRHESREDAGVVTSVAVSPKFGPIAAATLRNEAAQEGVEIMVGDVLGVVRHMPLRRSE